MQREFIAGPFETQRGYSPVVKTVGGAHVWVAGQTGARNEEGKPAYGDFEAQTRQCFRNIEVQLAKAGGKLSDLVYMTVFLKDQRHGPKFLELRREILKKDFPVSALITVVGFADPAILLEIQSIAVVDA
ncbi:MAG TPA: RidA family protein [Stellaceae bacterium]|jgi:enamine deaminase RidA (YjgF/YER057c/UK114 family)|nr:RidA family protein [Stellaceae bacterium]